MVCLVFPPIILYLKIVPNKHLLLDGSQLFDSQTSQSLVAEIRTLNPYQLPSAPTARESSGQPSSTVSPSRPRGRRGTIRSVGGSSSLSGTSRRRALRGQSMGTALAAMLEDGEE